MRRLTLILSDLFLPEEAVHSQLPQALPLPDLDVLLRFADAPRRISDWRTWLAGELQPELAPLPIAQACAHDWPVGDAATAWLATPVHLEARLDHVRLTDRGLLHLDAAARAACRGEFARAFGPQYALHDVGERGFLLSGMARAAARTVDPARLLDSDIGPALPQGPQAAELRRLGAEIEMWLHGAALNAARDQARLPRVSALWLWGGGAGDPSDPMAVAAQSGKSSGVHFFGADPFIVSLSRATASGTSTTFPEIAGLAGHVVVEQAPMTGPHEESLPALEARWFAPLRAAIDAGSLAQCDVIANDRWFRIGVGGRWKFWRRRVHWLQRLATAS